MKARQSTFVSALAGSFFLILGVVLVVLGSKFKSTENNFWLGFIGLGVLIESLYLAAHFLLRALTPRELASICSRVIAALVAIPLTFITGTLFLWAGQAAFAVDTDEMTVIAFLALVGITLGLPTVLLWWYAIGLLKKSCET